MQVRYIGGVILSTYKSAAAITRGRAVKLNSDSEVTHAGNLEKGIGIAAQTARAISSGFNIFASSYDMGLSADYYGRRNPYQVTYCNVGDPIGIYVGAGHIFDTFNEFVGTVAALALLTSNASGQLTSTSVTAENAIAQALTGGVKGTSTITIKTL